MTIDPYKPIPWEAFTLIPTPRQRRATNFARTFAILCALAVICGALAAFNH